MPKMRLQESPFNKIKSGNKTIELRLLDKKRSKLNIGDELSFFYLNYDGEKIDTRVIDLVKSSSFDELCNEIDIKDAGFDDKEGLISCVNELYSIEEQKEYGVVAIKIELI